MHHWNNPIVSLKAFEDTTAWEQMQHGGQHCILYDPRTPLNHIQRVLTLDMACNQANALLSSGTLFTNQQTFNEIANLVRINMFYHSIVQQGNIKPMLLQYTGCYPYNAATGGTRMAAIELISNIQSVQAFVSTHKRVRHELAHLQEVLTWHDFCNIAGAQQSSTIYLRLTDYDADYGLDWYEVGLTDPAMIVPQDKECLVSLERYVESQSNSFRFYPDWFREKINWTI